MLNNKGFAVSAVLYTLLILFLVFLGVSLSMFSASNNLISFGNRDLVDGVKFEVGHVMVDKKINHNKFIRIKSKYGTCYWPESFPVFTTGTTEQVGCNNKIKVEFFGGFQNIKDKLSNNITVADWKHAKVNNYPVVPNYIKISYKDDENKQEEEKVYPKYDNKGTVKDAQGNDIEVLRVLTWFSE